MSQATTPLGQVPVQLLVPTNTTAETTTVAGVDLKDFVDDILIILSAKRPNASAGASFSLSFKDSPDNSTFTAVAGGPTIALAAATTETTATVSINTRSIQRYLQASYITLGTTGTYNASVVAIGLKQVV
jgi:hypothetical protein